MRNLLYLFVVTLVIFGGCTNPSIPQEPNDTTSTNNTQIQPVSPGGQYPRFEAIAEEYVRGLAEFGGGQDLHMAHYVPEKCPGCYEIEMQFIKSTPAVPEAFYEVSVNVTLQDWQVTHHELSQVLVMKDIICHANGQQMSRDDAYAIARASTCIDEVNLTMDAFCNNITGTWWIDAVPNENGCNPACVVDVAAKTAEINWRCTGLVPPPLPQ